MGAPYLLNTGKGFEAIDIEKCGKPIEAALSEEIRRNRKAEVAFHSSQDPRIFDLMHRISDLFISGISEKIDMLLREIVKNAEKENLTRLLKSAGMIPQQMQTAPLDLMKQVLSGELKTSDGKPLLYSCQGECLVVRIEVRENELVFEVENAGEISEPSKQLILRRILLGKKLAEFDLKQEFEMGNSERVMPSLRAFFEAEFTPAQLNDYWNRGIGEEFEDYWNNSPYFMLMNNRTYTALYPFYATAYGPLRLVQKKEECPDQRHFSAGLGYIQCSYILEANRNIYGTYGSLFTPENRDGKTVTGFAIGLPRMGVLY